MLELLEKYESDLKKFSNNKENIYSNAKGQTLK